MPVGFQDFWVAGSRLYYKRDAVDGVEQPWADLGIIETASPGISPEKIELVDGDGGVKKTIQEAITKIDESYEITCRNLSFDNLALVFLSKPPAVFSRTRASYAINTKTWRGYPIALIDNVSGTLLLNKAFNIEAMEGACFGAFQVRSVTSIVASTRTINFSGGAFSPALSNGDKIILSVGVGGTELGDVANAGTYTVQSSTASTVVVEETTLVDQAGAGGSLVGSGTGGEVLEFSKGGIAKGDDFEVINTARGLIRIATTPAKLNTTPHVDGQNVTYFFTEAATSGLRSLNPQAAQGEIRGQAIVVWSRGNNAEQTAREARVSITPSGAQIQVEDYSTISFGVKVLSDPTVSGAGRALYFKGSNPAVV